MNSNTFRMPVRRLAATSASLALLTAPAALATTGTAHATTEQGRASAVVLRTGLDVSLLDKTVQVPLDLSLNEVQAPRSSEKTALTATLDGVDHGKPFTVLRADAASAEAEVTKHKAEGRTELAHAKVHVPGLPLLSLIEVGAVSSRATCEAGRKPVAEADLLGAVTVLGKKVSLTTGGTTEVKVPGVGEVGLALSSTRTTSRTAAASALELKVSVNPLELNVAEVEGTVTLAGATCEAPTAPPAAKPQPKPEKPVADVEPKTSEAKPEQNLAETGGSSTTPYLAGGGAVLLGLGGGAVLLARRNRNNRASRSGS
ncbi:SCO1860 family LAETG-anchored protein [Streptomyces physcomitrii]|uniref:LPXTG cell wall anchor domain-containing protein n=1 Tax=Streptomyces physcomitrii TaxID=2724184 RepID=A0ABX1H1N7_9ACTN|nr:SCO1860 family LAETG-anchored protein [Streptomyces physcomitrii]NKI41204.1 LPXTG cell wall anchor domain-containing protein [Streptomyces physcomitrii]